MSCPSLKTFRKVMPALLAALQAADVPIKEIPNVVVDNACMHGYSCSSRGKWCGHKHTKDEEMYFEWEEYQRHEQRRQGQ